MNRLGKYSLIIRNAILAIIFIDILFTYKPEIHKLIPYFIVFICLIINDVMRFKYYYENKAKFYFSLLLSILLGNALAYLAGGYTEIYIYIILYEIIMWLQGKDEVLLLCLHLGIVFYTRVLSQESVIQLLSLSFWSANGIDISMTALFFAFYILTVKYIKLLAFEKRKLEKLNNELTDAYDRLQDYSTQIEELTISNERNRVAQELHDSLGHSLTAIIMHLDYVENILYEDLEKASDIIIKVHDLARNSMKDVRKAVYALKEDITTHGFENSIHILIGNLTETDNVEVEFNIEGSDENISPDIQRILYITLKEALTNGIKHGKASKFIVHISFEENRISLLVSDNGTGCDCIHKGNGLNGIEKRISALRGEVSYTSNLRNGFIINVIIPIDAGVTESD